MFTAAGSQSETLLSGAGRVVSERVSQLTVVWHAVQLKTPFDRREATAAVTEGSAISAALGAGCFRCKAVHTYPQRRTWSQRPYSHDPIDAKRAWENNGEREGLISGDGLL